MSAKEVDLEQITRDMALVAQSQPDLSSLRGARELLTSAGFARQLEAIIARSHNRPASLSEFANQLRGLKFQFRDLLTERSELHSQISLLAVTGGSTLVVGAVVAAATQILVFPPLALLAVGAGGYSVVRGVITNRRLALEISCLNDMVEVLDKHVEKLQVRP